MIRRAPLGRTRVLEEARSMRSRYGARTSIQRARSQVVAASLFLWILAVPALLPGGGCGDAYTTVVPRQKTPTEMELYPDFARVGETIELHAILFTPSENNYVHDFDFGDGIDLIAYDSGAGEGCSEVATESVTVPDLFEQTYLYPLCFTLVVQSTASLGERSFTIEVESAGTPIIARAVFYVLPARS